MPKRSKNEHGDTKHQKKERKKAKTSHSKVVEPVEKIKLKDSPYVGELLFCGGTNWDMIGRWRLPKAFTKDASKPPPCGRNLWGPHRLSALSGIKVRNVISGPHACHSIIITEEGTAMSWGRNEQEQLGLGHSERVDTPTVIETLKNKHIVNAACGRTHTLCLTDEGSVYAFGDNRLGQLGIGCQSASVGNPCKINYSGSPIVKVACGAEFSMILDCKGSLHSFGCQEYSQLGHNSNGKFAVKGTKTSSQNITSPRKIILYVSKQRDGTPTPIENIVMKDVVCGNNHTVAMDMQKRVFTWGFGGYGRLGHGEPRDEPVPRSIRFFEYQGKGAHKIFAGSSYSMVIIEQGTLYFWGQTKSTGEATMYPKPIHDLTGWNVRDVGCSNSSIVIAADESVISWGPSPTYGELGYGEHEGRSSTHAKKAKPLDGLHIHVVSCGMGHSLMIARDDSHDDKEKISTIPIFDPRVPQSIPGTPYVRPPEPEPEPEPEVKEEEIATSKTNGGTSEANSHPNEANKSEDVKIEQKTENSIESTDNTEEPMDTAETKTGNGPIPETKTSTTPSREVSVEPQPTPVQDANMTPQPLNLTMNKTAKVESPEQMEQQLKDKSGLVQDPVLNLSTKPTHNENSVKMEVDGPSPGEVKAQETDKMSAKNVSGLTDPDKPSTQISDSTSAQNCLTEEMKVEENKPISQEVAEKSLSVPQPSSEVATKSSESSEAEKCVSHESESEVKRAISQEKQDVSQPRIEPSAPVINHSQEAKVEITPNENVPICQTASDKILPVLENTSNTQKPANEAVDKMSSPENKVIETVSAKSESNPDDGLQEQTANGIEPAIPSTC